MAADPMPTAVPIQTDRPADFRAAGAKSPVADVGVCSAFAGSDAGAEADVGMSFSLLIFYLCRIEADWPSDKRRHDRAP